MPDGDIYREIDKLEARLNRELDRRFESLETEIGGLSKKIDDHIATLESRQYEKSTWTIRQIVTVLISFTLGGGALGIVQSIINLLAKGR